MLGSAPIIVRRRTTEPCRREPMNRALWACPFVVVSICLALAPPALAQSTGTLTGTVVDGSGAALPGATVTATDAATSTTRPVTSNEAGLFRIPALNPGRYT